MIEKSNEENLVKAQIIIDVIAKLEKSIIGAFFLKITTFSQEVRANLILNDKRNFEGFR